MLRAERKKTSLIVTGFILILIAIAYVIWISNQYQHQSLEATKENLLSKAENLKLFIESHLNKDVQDLEGVSQNHEITNLTSKTDHHDHDFCPLKVVQHANNTEFVVVAFLDKDGNIKHIHFESQLDSVDQFSLINLPEVSQVIKNLKPVIGKSYAGKGETRLINIVFPVFTEGEFSGAIFVAYDITAFCNKYFNTVYHRANAIEITDEEGHYLFNSQPGIPDLGNYLVSNDSIPPNLSSTDREQYEILIHHVKKYENNSTIVTYPDSNGDPDQVVLAHIPLLIGKHHYRILVYDNLNKTTHPTFSFIRNIFYVLAVLIAIFILFWVFGWSWLHNFVRIKKEVTLLSKISQSENRYWELFNASPIPIVVLTPSGVINIGNQQFLKYIGRSHISEVFGRNLTDVIQFTDKHQITSLFQMVKRKIRKEGNASLQISFYHPDGSLKTGEFIGSEFKFDQQKNLLCIINDLTEKKLAENLSLRFGRILSNSFNEIYVIDVQSHHFLHATDGALKNLGYTIEELRKLTPDQLVQFGEGNFETVIKPLTDRTQDQLFLELLLKRKNGQAYPVEVSLQISHEENPPVFIAIMRDLTQVKKAAETISVERSKAMEYLELAEVMFVALDKSNIITLINRKGCEILGYTQEELIGKNWIETCIPNEARTVVQDNFTCIIDEALITANNFENQVITKQNQHKLISWQNKSILNASGEIAGFLCSGMDITDARKQEFDLKESQRKYSTLIGNLNGIVYRCRNNASWTMEFVSHGIFKMTGYTPEEMINNSSVSYIDIIHPEDRINVKTTIKEALKNDQNYQVEYRIITKTKQTIWVTEIGKGIKEGDKTQYLEGFITDITQQKQAQEELIISQLELEKSVSLFKALSGASFEAIFISKHGVCIGLNRTAELMFGYSEEEALGKKDTQWFVPEDHERIKQRLLGGSEEPYEGTALRIDGETFPCEIKTRVAEYQGNMVLFTSITNISRRKEAQKNLLESEARYRELIQNNTSVMLLFDPLTGEIVEANKAACAFYGLTEKQLKETRIFDLNTLDQKEIEKELSKLKSGEKSYFVFKHYTARGIIKDVELYTGQINYRGRMLYFSVIHDITEKLQNQRDLIRAKEKAEESDKLKSAFLANMSHEIRTPMNAILGFSQLLTDSDTTPDEMTNYIQIINQSGQQLLELIDDIIKISQIEAGIITLNYQETNLTALLNEMQALFSLQVKQKEIDLNLVFPTDPIKTIYTDPARLKQVLINLLSNAVKFTHQGGVSFGYVREGDHLKFYVQDSGIGINTTHHKLIFDRFMQVRQNKNKLYGGTGIGLSISKALVEKMNGTIWLTSEESKGTTFYFTLPIAGEIDDNKHKAIEIVTHQPVDILRNKHILIVEDDESNRSLLVLFLKSAHVILHFAENGIEAIEQVKQVPGIAAVLMDIKMPGMGGIEATIEIKKLRPGLPVIIQTAYAMANEKEEALKAGSNAYLAKPLERQALINELILQITKSETQG